MPAEMGQRLIMSETLDKYDDLVLPWFSQSTQISCNNMMSAMYQSLEKKTNVGCCEKLPCPYGLQWGQQVSISLDISPWVSIYTQQWKQPYPRLGKLIHQHC